MPPKERDIVCVNCSYRQPFYEPSEQFPETQCLKCGNVIAHWVTLPKAPDHVVLTPEIAEQMRVHNLEAQAATDARLVESAVRNAHYNSTRGIGVRWGHVSHAVAVGSTSAIALCRRFGLDPDEEVGWTHECQHCGEEHPYAD